MPGSGYSYLNRANIRPGMLEQVAHIFRQHGFTEWGGNWNDPIDWMHFQTPRAIAELLATLQLAEGEQFFAFYIKNHAAFKDMSKMEAMELFNRSR